MLNNILAANGKNLFHFARIKSGFHFVFKKSYLENICTNLTAYMFR